MSELASYPLVNQLDEPTSDGQEDENSNNNCVVACIASALCYFTGRPFNGDEIKDANPAYGQGYEGMMDAANFQDYCSQYHVTMQQISDSPAALVAAAHQQLQAGYPCLIYVGWDDNPSIPHAVCLFAEHPNRLSAMNPWGGYREEGSDDDWSNRLFYQVLWIFKGAKNMPIPQGWKDDASTQTLTAPNHLPVRLGFRSHILHADHWDDDNYPLETEVHVDHVEQSSPNKGGGQRQLFRKTMLVFTGKEGVYEAWIGQELQSTYEGIATRDKQLSDQKVKLDLSDKQLADQKAKLDTTSKQVSDQQTKIAALQQQIAGMLKNSDPTSALHYKDLLNQINKISNL